MILLQAVGLEDLLLVGGDEVRDPGYIEVRSSLFLFPSLYLSLSLLASFSLSLHPTTLHSQLLTLWQLF